MIREIKGLSFESHIQASEQLLFLIRTDFDTNYLIDYISNSKEYFSIPVNQQDGYLHHYIKRVEDNSGIINWSEKIASLTIGIAVGLSENLDLCIESIEADLSELNNHFQFSAQNLKSYQLFDIYACKP